MRRRKEGARRYPRRTSRTMLVYCGAIRTEVAYLDGLKAARRLPGISVVIRGQGIALSQLVRAAAAHRDRRPTAYDEVWCVVDVDQFDIPAAVVEARRHGVSLAISNPCFELWLVLHHDDCRTPCAACASAVGLLTRYVPSYDKTKLRFRDFESGVEAAVKRARRLEPTGQDWARNPSTSMWQLVERLMEKS